MRHPRSLSEAHVLCPETTIFGFEEHALGHNVVLKKRFKNCVQLTLCHLEASRQTVIPFHQDLRLHDGISQTPETRRRNEPVNQHW